MVPLQLPGGVELVVLVFALVLNALLVVGFLGGLGYFLLRIRSGGSVDERLDRIERKIGRLEAHVERLEADAEVDRRTERTGDDRSSGADDGD